MRIDLVSRIFVIAIGVIFSSSLVYAADIGFSAGLLAQHTGKSEIFDDQETNAESSGIPLKIFMESESIRVAYQRYSQYAKDTYSEAGITGDGTATFNTEVLSVSYVHPFLNREGDMVFYGSAGIGLFQSVMTAEAYLTDGSSFYTQTTQRRTSGLFNPGFLLGAGMKKSLGNAFIGSELNYLNANLDFEKVDDEDEFSLDASGFIVSLVAGVSF